jgi:hypothetical protein
MAQDLIRWSPKSGGHEVRSGSLAINRGVAANVRAAADERVSFLNLKFVDRRIDPGFAAIRQLRGVS